MFKYKKIKYKKIIKINKIKNKNKQKKPGKKNPNCNKHGQFSEYW